MVAQRHIIKRQVLQLTLTEPQAAYAMQQELSRIYRQRLLPIIERHCNDLSTPDRLYRIPRLELDLGTINTAHLEEELVTKVNAILRRELTDKIKHQETTGTTAQADSKAFSQLELFTLFARHGILPWWTDPMQPKLLENCLYYLLRHAPVSLRRLLRELLKEEQAIQRIIQYFGDPELANLTALFTSLSIDYVLQFAMVLKKLHPHVVDAYTTSQFRYQIWREILIVSRVPSNQFEFVKAVLPRLATKLEITYPVLLASLYEAEKTNNHNQITEILEKLSEEREVTALTPSPLMGEGEDLPVMEMAAINTSDPKLLSLTDPTFTDIEEIYLNNAGLVLLWPFLNHFFESLKLVFADRFLDTNAIYQAIVLLHYLATGDPDIPPEFLLPLNKLLCGLDLDQNFVMDTILTTAEQQECGQFLEAVIDQAPVLNRMSISGFRGTFLLRQGQLSSRDGMWLLRVERETYDIVLERFPWPIIWVKLPWMKLPLRVEW